MTILCLDLGTKTGYMLSNGKHGFQDFATKRHEGGGMRYLRFRRWLENLHKAEQFNEVYYEEVRRHIGTSAAHIYGGLQAAITTFCEERNIPYSSVPVQTIKKKVTGKGNASKKEVIDAFVNLGYAVTDDNEADAIAIYEVVK